MTLSCADIVARIKRRQTFSATADGGGFSIKINNYEPTFSAAIHNGHNLRQDLMANCLLSQAERYYEEDPYTATFIDKQPITLVGHDSRYEYDLNRPTEECVYKTAWGKDVWRTSLSSDAIDRSKEKHRQFYEVVSALTEVLLEDFGQCLVYDLHSYNFKRHQRLDLPVFNLGTSTMQDDYWHPLINSWLQLLKDLKVDGVEITAAENDIFSGKGNLAGHCHRRYDKVLVLATEVKKVFMDELSGNPSPQILSSLQHGLNGLIMKNTAAYVAGVVTSASQVRSE